MGGARPGAGRPAGRLDEKTIMKKAAISKLYKDHTKEAVDTMVFHMRNKRKTPELSQRAAEYIVNRVYGTPTQALKLSPDEDESDEFEFTMKFTRRGDK